MPLGATYVIRQYVGWVIAVSGGAAIDTHSIAQRSEERVLFIDARVALGVLQAVCLARTLYTVKF